MTTRKYHDTIKTVKGGDSMKKPFNTSIEETVQKEFKQRCRQSSPELPMNTVLEILMDGYNKGKFKIVVDVLEVEK